MIQDIVQATEAYFIRPIRETTHYYESGLLTMETGGEIRYASIADLQPVGREWTLHLFDSIGEDLCYAHVGYSDGEKYCHEVLAFLRIESGWKLTAVLRVATDTRYRNVCRNSEDEVRIYEEIEKMLLVYSDAVYNLDADAALAVFTPECRMIHPLDGKSFADVSCNVFRERWNGVPHPQTLGLPKYSRIYHVELIDECTAVAKIGMAKLNEHFNDYLFCVKTDGRWMIAQKLTESVWKNPPTLGE